MGANKRRRRPRAEVANSVSGQAGEVVQARTIYGGVHIHAPEPRAVQPVVPRQLPLDVVDFTGRSEELELLNGLARHGTAVVISGMAGVGKTSLAVHWAHQQRFPDGELFVNLRGYDAAAPMSPEQVLDKFLLELGVPRERIPPDLAAKVGLYRSMLAGRLMVILLDNAATADQVRPVLPASPTCLVVVTSRSRLSGLAARDGARRLTLDVLSSAEAVELLRRTIGEERAEPQALTTLALYCAHLPLALRIAAERVASRPHLLVADLIEDLRRERSRLDVLAVPDDEGSAVGVVFSWSYHALRPEAARLFRLLSLHPGPDISAPAAAALMGTTSVGHLLDTLSGVHLIAETEPGRYRMHDLLRAYAAQRVAAEDAEETRAEAVHRLLTWYLRTADEAVRAFAPEHLRIQLGDTEPELSGHGVEWCEAELANLTAAVDLAAQHGHHDIAWQLPAVLWDFFNTRKPWAEWISTHVTGLASARRTGDRDGEAWMLNNLGAAYRDLGRFAEAISCFQQALDIRRDMGDRNGEGWTLYNLGDTYRVLRRFDDAITHLRHALAISREVGETWGEGWTLNMLGDTHRKLGQFDDAIGYLTEALVIRRKTGDRWGEGWTLNMLGDTHRKLDRFDDAIDYLSQALAISQENGHRYLEGRNLRSLGDALAAVGKTREARECWLRTLAILEATGDPRAEGLRARLERDESGGQSA